MMIEGKFVKFTTHGLYIEEAIVAHLLLKWKHKTAEELGNTLEFYMDLVTCKFVKITKTNSCVFSIEKVELMGFNGKRIPGPYEKLVRIVFILPLTGIEFCRKVSEMCRIACENAGLYSEAEAKAIEQLKDVFKDKNFLPGYCTLFSISSAGLGVSSMPYILRIHFIIFICFFALIAVN